MYHWVISLRRCHVGSDQGSSFFPVAVADERALRLDDGDATVVFGLGPAVGCAADGGRLHEVAKALGLRAARWARQVHSSTVVRVEAPRDEPEACVGAADGLITSEIGVGLAVWTADCVPVILVAPGAVAAVHAGWRGCADGIAAVAVSRLTALDGRPPETLTAYLGPAISARHYEVGPEVAATLAATGVDPTFWLHGDRVDLRNFLTAQLATLGVSRVHSIGQCTFHSRDLASYRRDGEEAGRQWSLVFRTPTHPSSKLKVQS